MDARNDVSFKNIFFFRFVDRPDRPIRFGLGSRVQCRGKGTYRIEDDLCEKVSNANEEETLKRIRVYRKENLSSL